MHKECHKCGEMFEILDADNLEDAVVMESINDGGDYLFVWLCPSCKDDYDGDASEKEKGVDP